MVKESQSRKITFTTTLLEMADYKAAKLGLNFQDYIKLLIAKDIENIVDRFDRISVEELMELNIAIDPNKHSKYIVATRREEFRNLLNSWKRSFNRN